MRSMCWWSQRCMYTSCQSCVSSEYTHKPHRLHNQVAVVPRYCYTHVYTHRQGTQSANTCTHTAARIRV